MKLAKESSFKLAVPVIIGSIALQYLIEPLKEKCPETIYRTIISNESGNMGSIVVIGLDDVVSIQLVISCRVSNLSK